MKQCPACKTTYTDQTLRFCLADGNVLNDVANEQPTLVRNLKTFSAEKTVSMDIDEPNRTETPGKKLITPSILDQQKTPAQGTLFKIIIVFLGLGIFLALAVAVGTFVYFNIKENEQTSNLDAKTVKSPVSVSPTPVKDENNELREQIANLERLFRDQKTNSSTANTPAIKQNQTGLTIARANSPGDGFLALRSLPNSETGERILKIPHGAIVYIGSCGPTIKPVSRSGRWCQASYEGYSGWVFDAYLIYQK